METRALLKMMGLNVPVYDSYLALKELWSKDLCAGILGEIVNIPDNWGKFKAYKAGSKVYFKSCYNITHDLMYISTFRLSYMDFSEVRIHSCEWRCFVRWCRVLGSTLYSGDYHAQFDASVIDEAISCWKDAPIAYGLYCGVTRWQLTCCFEK